MLIHTADPVAFFDPVDARNERLEELAVHPDWSFHGDEFPSFERLLDAFEAVVAAHPQTTFIGAHVACCAEDLAWVGRMLDTYPNLHLDFSQRIAELGRQPRAARRLFVAHADRVLFGTDELPPRREAYERLLPLPRDGRRALRLLARPRRPVAAGPLADLGPRPPARDARRDLPRQRGASARALTARVDKAGPLR